MKLVVPPIKSQGIKTKLVEWIRECASAKPYERWVEPFMGTGVVAFNIRPKAALLCDSNPHTIGLYQAIQGGEITAGGARAFLTREGAELLRTEGEHYYAVRERFNRDGDPLDFLFLSRSCFNGMMRFNRSGGFNVPFCRKPQRFARALVTRICNQIAAVAQVIREGDYRFECREFGATLAEVGGADMAYCDPPYIGRHTDYFNSWSDDDEAELHRLLVGTKAPFIVSTWLRNRYRTNDYVFSLWSDCSIAARRHFYHLGARESNRNEMFEALLTNFGGGGSVPVGELDLDGLQPAAAEAIQPAPTGQAQLAI